MASLFTTILCIIFSSLLVNAKIINGYAKDMKGAKMALRNLNILSQDTTLSKKRRKLLKGMIKKMEIRQKSIVSYYTKTENLLQKLTEKDPELYFEIDNIVDAEDNDIDVFVCVVGDNILSKGVVATTNLNCDPENPNLYVSEFGPKSVSVRIYRYGNPLINLIHEFGHVRYQVPNLAAYMDYYVLNYTEDYLERNGQKIGHKFDDPSHLSVVYTKSRYYSKNKYNNDLQAKK